MYKNDLFLFTIIVINIYYYILTAIFQVDLG